MTLWLILLAAAVGSFIACAAVRLPKGQGLGGRSACPYCNHRLCPSEMIPVLSWLWLRGRCRTCQAPVSPLYPAVELGAVAVAIAAQLLDGTAVWICLALGWAGLFFFALLPGLRLRE